MWSSPWSTTWKAGRREYFSTFCENLVFLIETCPYWMFKLDMMYNSLFALFLIKNKKTKKTCIEDFFMPDTGET